MGASDEQRGATWADEARTLRRLVVGHMVLFGLGCLALALPYLGGPSAACEAVGGLFRLGHGGLLALGLLTTIMAVVGVVHGATWAIKERRLRPLLAGLSLLALPPLYVLVLGAGAAQLRAHGRETAIAHAAPLLRAIEDYRAQHGHYPDKLELLVPDLVAGVPAPEVMGICAYRYERTGEHYVVEFPQSTDFIGFNWEVVAYHPQDQHVARGELKRLSDTGHEHWKYYVFD